MCVTDLISSFAWMSSRLFDISPDVPLVAPELLQAFPVYSPLLCRDYECAIKAATIQWRNRWYWTFSQDIAWMTFLYLRKFATWRAWLDSVWGFLVGLPAFQIDPNDNDLAELELDEHHYRFAKMPAARLVFILVRRINRLLFVWFTWEERVLGSDEVLVICLLIKRRSSKLGLLSHPTLLWRGRGETWGRF